MKERNERVVQWSLRFLRWAYRGNNWSMPGPKPRLRWVVPFVFRAKCWGLGCHGEATWDDGRCVWCRWK